MTAPFALMVTSGPEWVRCLVMAAQEDGFAAWAQKTAAERTPTSPRLTRGARTVKAATYYRAVGAELLRQGAVEAFLLTTPDRVAAIMSVKNVVLKGPATHEGFVAFVHGVLPDPADDVIPPEIGDVATGAGTAVRVVTRTVRAGDPDSPILEAVHHYWWFPDHQMTVVMIAEYTDLVGMDPWRASIEGLATNATRPADPDGGPGPATMGLAA